MTLSRATQVLTNEHQRLTTVNEYLKRQIEFLKGRITQFEADRVENLSALAEIEEIQERINPASHR